MTKKQKLLEEIANHQANLSILWLAKPTFGEAMLMAALRHLHAVIEDDPEIAEHQKSLYWRIDDEL